MKLGCLSDQHGHLPSLAHLDFDVLLIAGDITPHPARDWGFQARWLDVKFRKWLERLEKPVFATWGNHDLVGEQHPELVPRDLPWTLLIDKFAVLPNGMTIYGSPWQLTFPRPGIWAFNDDEDNLRGRWAAIPERTDVLLLHGPPYGTLDYSNYGRANTGSPSLAARIDRVVPKAVIFGHIHESYGILDGLSGTIFVNASHVDENYQPVNPVIIVEV